MEVYKTLLHYEALLASKVRQARLALFRECRALADALGLHDCSMGMSGDWREAVTAGSTWVRLGSVLFGSRPIQP
jgi:uncharacterized pyridoxal phosphate-containing UPF0001 family protein